MEKESARPILFLDVDGVLNIDSVPRYAKPMGFEKYRIWDDEINRTARYTVWLNKIHGVWLNTLTDIVDLAWATTWNDRANTAIAGRIGLSYLPVAYTNPRVGQLDEKTESIMGMAGDRPIIWIDDNITPVDTYKFADRKVKFIHSNPHYGLQMRDIMEIRLWVEYIANVERNSRSV